MRKNSWFRIAAALLAVSFVIPTAVSCIGRKTGEEYKENIIFKTSFEKDETVSLMASTLEGDKSSSVVSSAATGGSSPMMTERGTGPAFSWVAVANAGWTGESALTVSGVHSGSGEAYCTNTIYSGLNITVTPDMRLSYMIFPSTRDESSYDYEYTQMYLSVDIAFADGTYLSDLGAIDQNGFGVNPVAQGESDALFTNQWNHIESKIGDVANGKVIDRLLIAYRKPDNANGGSSSFLDYFDDIIIKTAPDRVYEHVSDYVNILRGTNSKPEMSRGVTTPAVTYPHGFNLFTPVTDSGSTIPYYYQTSGERNTISGFQVSHCASSWVGFYGSYQFMPNTSLDGTAETLNGDMLKPDVRKSAFSHSNEIAKAHYYSLTFDEGGNASGVKVEMTPTMYGAMIRLTYPENAEHRNLVFSCDDAAGKITFDEDKLTFEAYTDKTNTDSRRMYISGGITDVKKKNVTYNKVGTKYGVCAFGDNVKTVTIKLATSFISYEQAKKNLDSDISSRDDFDSVMERAQKAWDETLGVVEIEGATFTQLTTYYSCLYRVYAFPNLYTENTGTESDPKWQYASPYEGTTSKPAIKDGALVCNTGLWDTYRTAWPAYSFFQATDTTKLMNGLVTHYTDNGWNGQWMVVKGIQCMIGTHSDIVYADAMVKDISFDRESAWKSMVKDASVVNKGGVGREESRTAPFTGYISNGTARGLSWTLDGCINDYGLYVAAQKFGKTDEAEYYRNRSLAYVNVFNSDVGFFLGKDKNGKWSQSTSSFNPCAWTDDYCEANAWNEAFFMVQDVKGMATLYGGLEAYAAKLDQFFSTPCTNVDRNSIHEVRELREVRMGQYEHSNQIAHHITYMYDYAGQAWKTQEKVRSVLARCYVGSEIGQGYVGDEDNGEQSGWYVFSALGFYPMSLASGEYAIGSPLFSKTTIHLKSGDVTIIANNNSTENIYIQSCKVNGESYNKCYLTQELFSSGKVTIEFEMGSTPSSWGTASDSLPSSLTTGDKVEYKTDKLSAAVCAVGGTDAASALFDNTSDTVASSNGQIIAEASFAEAQTASIVTVTSSTDAAAAPTGYKLLAANNGTDWTELDSRSDLSFEWAQYTRPFAIPEDRRGAYTKYRIELTGGGNMQVAELELICA